MTAERSQALLEDIRLVSQEHYELVQALLTLIRAVAPHSREEVKYGGFLFSVERSACGVFAYTHHISLEFSRGCDLPDPHQVLEGTGKYRRHIKLFALNDIEDKHVAEYLRRTFDPLERV